MSRSCVALVFVVVLTGYWFTRFQESPYNEPVLQADALLHGRAWIETPPYIERVVFEGHAYALHPPGAALMLLPLVSLLGLHTPQTAFSIVLGAVNIALCYLLLCRFDIEQKMRFWLIAFIAFGTVLWYEAVRGSTWSLPIVCGVFWTLLALIELFGRARPLALGVFLAAGCLTRYDIALAVPALLMLAWLRGRTIRELLYVLPPFVAAGVVFVVFNLVRYHSWFDQGIPLISPGGKVASLKWLPQNLNTLFCLAPAVDAVWPFVHLQPAGQSILLTSPAFALALDVRPSKETCLMWLAALGIALPSLLCWANGWTQFGARHYIQCYPFLLVLMVSGPAVLGRMGKALILISIALCGYGVWYLHRFPGGFV